MGWGQEGARALYGQHVDGFPNMIMGSGPQGASLSTDGIGAAEDNCRWAVSLILHMRESGKRFFDVKPEAMRRFLAYNQRHASHTVWTRCQTYYNDARGRT